MNQKYIVVVVITLILLGGVGGWFLLNSEKPLKEKLQITSTQTPTPEVSVIERPDEESANKASKIVIPKADSLNYDPVINPSDFVSKVDNKYFSLEPGKTLVYEGVEDGEPVRQEVTVTNEAKEILGVKVVVVRDKVFIDSELAEDTKDWYAQDKDGNVWYFGEDTAEYDEGKVVSRAGSWEAGVKGAKPGVIMTVDPKVGDSWRQEYFKGEAEDAAEVLSVNETVKVKAGTFKNCVKTKDWNALEPNISENKYYCAGNVVLSVGVQGSSDKVELVTSSIK